MPDVPEFEITDPAALDTFYELGAIQVGDEIRAANWHKNHLVNGLWLPVTGVEDRTLTARRPDGHRISLVNTETGPTESRFYFDGWRRLPK